MKFKHVLVALSMVGLVGATAFTNAEDTPKDGKTIFTEAKCEGCHSVASLGIESKKKNPFDLSTVGKAGDAEFFVKYMNKEAEIEGKKHAMKFKGSEDDLKILAKWLSELKEEKK